ncbi:MAG: Glu/Leu/Phe/Val dehydrogenase [Proteobacteria bacterium]|nr:Glu/Leu/Phe/Val dehydrogenase [Pseudomonadota bacterium]MBU1738428.1 Glu/Leu/Phe/Val dehydrogenase [Pseudomonadota bacterium]
MGKQTTYEPAMIFDYRDPLEGFEGWLVIDRFVHRLCAGGMRVQQGLTRDHLVAMARNMTKKMKIAGLRVDGAKCGIDYPPDSPGKADAVKRFLGAIAPYIRSNYSMGPDLNIDMAELEVAAAAIGIPSVKIAIAGCQGWTSEYFLERSEILNRKIDRFTLGQLRAGYGVSSAVLGMLEHLGIEARGATVAIQGFGNLAKAAIYGLNEAGVVIRAISDQNRCLTALTDKGLNAAELLAHRGTLLPDPTDPTSTRVSDRNDITGCTCDILVPAAIENTVTAEVASKLKVNAVVPGANLAITEIGAHVLYENAVPALPDFVAGSGGSLSMEGLYGPDEHPKPQDVLDHVKLRMKEMVKQVMERSTSLGVIPVEAALGICDEREDLPDTRPYGRLH